MSSETLSHLFEEFTQGDPSISRRFGGTGLGLAICRRVAAALGGPIRATSQLGRGKPVYDRDPVQRCGRASRDSDGGQAYFPAPSGMRVLVAEDNAVNQQVVVGLLMRIGADVVVVPNGRQAVAALGGQSFDLVLMDMQMPVMDGLAATRELRRQGVKTPIVGLTANAFESDRQACFDAGMDSFVAKPVTRAKLEAAIAEFAKGRPSAPVLTDQQSALIDEFGLEAYEALVAALVEDGRALLAEAQRAVDAETRTRAMHSLKGMARTLGFSDLGELAAIAEQAARSTGRSATAHLAVQLTWWPREAASGVRVAIVGSRALVGPRNKPTWRWN